jgi:hypothetical protein
LKCKPHKNDTALFCLLEKIFMCIECVKDHKDHSHEWIDGTNKKIFELFEQAVQILTERKNLLVDLIQNIKERMNSTQFTQDKILEIAQELKKLSE